MRNQNRIIVFGLILFFAGGMIFIGQKWLSEAARKRQIALIGIPIEKILAQRIINEVEYDAGGNPIPGSEREVVAYGYYTDTEIPPFENEIIELRTPKVITREINGQFFATSFLDPAFYQVDGIWHEIKTATTTKEKFDEAKKISWLQRFLNTAFADTSGPNNPGTMANDVSVGDTAWVNVDNAKTSDNTRAIVDLLGATSNYLKATSFGFSIPGNATINGILSEFERVYTAIPIVGGDGTIKDNSIKIVKDGVISGNEKSAGATWPTVEAYNSFGGSSDLWGLAWTPDDINDTTFGVVLSGLNDDGVEFGRRAQVDHIRITITYTPAASANPTKAQLQSKGTTVIQGSQGSVKIR